MTPITKVRVKLIGTDGNAFAILGRVVKAMEKANVADYVIQSYKNEAMASDYNNLLNITAKYVEVE